MHYGFWDTEYDDTNLRSFGFHLTNTNFQPLDSKEFIFYRRKMGAKYSTFAKHYDEVKSLLEKPKHLIGFAPANDKRILNIACNELGLPNIDVYTYDAQKMWQYVRRKHKLSIALAKPDSLRTASKSLNLDLQHGLKGHSALHDAMVAQQLFERLCEMENQTPEEMFEKFQKLGIEVTSVL